MILRPGKRNLHPGRGSPWWFRIVASLATSYIRLVHWTTRWQIEGQQELEGLASQDSGFISSLWHGRLFMSPTWTLSGRQNLAIISKSSDGDIISAIVHRFGVTAIRGSTNDRAKNLNKGGAEAFAAAKAALRDHGAVILMTPDGPRGPRMQAQAGIAVLAIATGVPVLPVSYSTRWGIFLATWDHFFLPFPFGRGAIVYGAPVYPPAKAQSNHSNFLLAIEQSTTAVMSRADELTARKAICSDLGNVTGHGLALLTFLPI